MNLVHKTKIAMAVSITVAAASNVTTVSAQDSLVLEEVIVSARKRDESLQDIPLSIRAISTQEIDRLGITTTEDIVSLSPGLTINKGIGGNDIRPDIRGITQLSGRSNVAILVDGIDQTTDALTGTGAGQLVGMGLFDLARVEVVKGPQSAIFGRNAFGGSISYITNRPSEEFEGKVEVEGAQYDTFKGKVSFSGPITEELLYRVNASYEDIGAQYDHPTTNKPLGENETEAYSLALQWLPTESISNLSRFDYSDQQMSQNAIAIAPYNSCQTTTESRRDPDGANELVSFDSQIAAGACDPVSNTATVGTVETRVRSQSVFRGDVPELDENDIQLSEQGVRGTRNEVTQFSNLLEWELSQDYSLISNTGLINHHGEDEFDLDHQGNLTNPQSGTAAFFAWAWASELNPVNAIIDVEFERDVIFQDVHLSFDAGDNIRWMAGAEYYKEDYDQTNYQRSNASLGRGDATIDGFTKWVPVGSDAAPETALTGGTITGTSSRKEERQTEVASVYGSFDWRFAESWELSLSARYQQDKIGVEFGTTDGLYVVPAFDEQKVDYALISPPIPSFVCGAAGGTLSPSGDLCGTTGVGAGTGGVPRSIEAEETFYSFNPRAALTYNYNDYHLFYVSVAEGSKPGGFNFDPGLTDLNRDYGQEKLTAYEFGWKSTWREGRSFFNGTIFFNENTDKQANNFQFIADGTSLSYVDNIGEIETQGIELKYVTYITEGLFFDLNYVYTDTEITEYETNVNPDGTPGADLVGGKLPWTPEHSVVGTLQYDWDLNQKIGMFVRLDTRFMSERNADIDGNAQFEAVSISDVKVGIVGDNYEVIGYVDNVLDERATQNGVAFVNFFQNFQDMFIGYPADKRTVGVRMSYSF
jgi:outer membrane receptor protein involved in Fe transport